AGGGAADDERGVVVVHWQRTGHEYLAREAAGPAQHVVDAVPVNSEQQDVRVLRRLARRARPRVSTGIARQALELLPAVRIAEDHLVSGAGDDRPELPAHQ